MPSKSSSVVDRASEVCDFIELALTISKGSHAGEKLRLRSWQRELLDDLFVTRPNGRRKYRQALIGLPRKNGKSALSSGIALYGLFMDDQGAEVYSCAGDKEQARIVFAEAKRSIESNETLSGMAKVYRDAIEYPARNAVYRVLSAEAYSKEGLNPSMVVFDEVHVQPNDELWNVMNLGSGTREQPLVLGITTAGVKFDSSGGESLCYRLWQYGHRVLSGEVDDPSFFFRWWGAPDDADHRDPAVWTASNPALGDYLFLEDFEATVKRTPEAEFRTKRLNQWVSAAETWLPGGAWDACAAPDVLIPQGASVVLGFDGSFNNDSTALVVCSDGVVPHIDVVDAWERPTDGRHDWQVPIVDVEEAIRAACRRWQVREIVCDPFRWARTYQILESEGLPIVEFPQNATRMVPATQRFYEAVVNETVTHSGDPRLARHLANCVIKTDARGSRLAKESKASLRKIDLAVAAVMAFDRASQIPETVPSAGFVDLNDYFDPDEE
jgi:phage terminase large subunit-like protein